jgi:hypothetical protein
VDGAGKSVALSEMDRRDGSLRSSQGEEFVARAERSDCS